MGLRGNVHGSSIARWKARGRLPIISNGTFSLALTAEHYEWILVKNVVFGRGWVILSTNFRKNGASPTNDCWRQKTSVPDLFYIIVCMILVLAILEKHRLATDGRTDRQIMTASTALA